MPYFYCCCQSMHFGFQFHVDFEPHVGLLSAQVYTINRGMKVNDKYAPIQNGDVDVDNEIC